jgi:hypothetical protein
VGKGELNMDKTEKSVFRHIIIGCALLLCVLFLVFPLVKCPQYACPLAKCFQYSCLTDSGWEMATSTGYLYKKGESAFILIIFPAVLLILAFINKPFIVLHNVSIAGLAAKILFLMHMYERVNSSNYKAFEVAENNWFIVLIYIGLVCFTKYCVELDKTGWSRRRTQIL